MGYVYPHEDQGSGKYWGRLRRITHQLLVMDGGSVVGRLERSYKDPV